MKRHHVVIGTSVLVAITVCALVFAFFIPLFKARAPVTEEEVRANTLSPEITLDDAYEKGVHTITGSVPVPNPCTTIEPSIELIASTSIRVDIIVIPAEGLCVQTLDEKKFKLSIEAPETSDIEVYVNGIRNEFVP